MNPAVIVAIVRMLLCDPVVKKWMETMAKDSSTPIDDVGVSVLYMLLSCK